MAAPQPSQEEDKEAVDLATDPEESTAPPKFSPEEEAASTPLVSQPITHPYLTPHQSLVAESNAKRTTANTLFTTSKYENAITAYEEAAAICPHYLDYELSVLKSNISACHLKLEQYKEAIKSATESLDGLSRVELKLTNTKDPEKTNQNAEEVEEAEEEIISTGAANSAPAPTNQDNVVQKRKDDIARIRAKALMRRARARSELGGWSNLSGAEEDYKELSSMRNLSSADEKIVRAQLRALPARTKEAQEKEMGEMWGKLKDLGNGILRPFGLSTENFNMVKDEKTGGYSMNFNQNAQG
ncbi:hypothetical protein F5Y18DRAFT_425547 [Xylariaceae sp. FL1019]|nr:hypothetical protein F5Y18DRAFT_425547 [Xylariaceae sp. FL1019]